MARRVLVLDGHPAGETFCGALAGAYADAARKAGHDVRIRHLSSMTFDPDFGFASYRDFKPWEPDLVAFWADLEWCEHVVIAHPLWWGGLPAKLKGLIDRVLLPGKAFSYERGDKMPKKLMDGRSSEVLVTADTPGWFFRLVYGSGVRKQMKHQILNFCGLKMKGYAWFSPIRSSTGDSRAAMLARAARLGAALG
ncbi:flavodoxin family protein [Roseibium sp. RKSG952]|nr:flavodoxin family protein [Roseibium sp. RKSG952]